MAFPTCFGPVGSDSLNHLIKIVLMLTDFVFSPSLFANGALLFYVIGLLMREGLLLRTFLLAGTGCYLLYYFTIADTPLWDAIYASTCIAIANIYSILRSIMDRSIIGMSHEYKELYGHFPTLTPGQFRRVMRCATWHKAEVPEELCHEGFEPEALYFVQKGPVFLSRSGQQTRIQPQQFLCEISFVQGRGSVASASVLLGAGARYVRWDRARLYRMMDRSLPLANAVSAMFNKDMSHKLARSWPHSHTSAQPGGRQADVSLVS